MSEPSLRRQRLEDALLADPGDGFLRYALAMELLKLGELDNARTILRQIMDQEGDEAVAAAQQLGQSLVESGDEDGARPVLERGIALAQNRRDERAAAEMGGLLDMLGPAS